MDDSDIRELPDCDISYEQAVDSDVGGDSGAEDCLAVPLKTSTPIKSRSSDPLNLNVGSSIDNIQGSLEDPLLQHTATVNVTEDVPLIDLGLTSTCTGEKRCKGFPLIYGSDSENDGEVLDDNSNIQLIDNGLSQNSTACIVMPNIAVEIPSKRPRISKA
ncbi:hypothetical protein J6590_018796 [Homalodisca vitripennis]|nr:hypothetical protein J6590_018796 [Homalodisca vitripennis]